MVNADIKLVKGENDLYYLSLGNMSDAEYDEVKPIVEHLNGHWRERYGCFVFGEDVSELLLEALCYGVDISEDYRWREENQFYPTPMRVAKRVVELAEVENGMSILEPSAGTGNLLDCLPKGDYFISCIEPMTMNCEVLKKKGYMVNQSTFEDVYNKLPLFDRVIMNPPFSGQRDIKHVTMAYHLLKPDGVLCAVISENALYYKTKTTENFKSFLKDINAYVEPVPSCSFEESGTTIETVLIKLRKRVD